MKALVLSGGGSKGSFQAGVIDRLSAEPSYRSGFDIVSGTSVGAINSSAIAMYNKKDFQEASRFLTDMWKSDLDIWSLKFPPYLAGLWNRSIGKNKGLKELLDKYLDESRIKNSNVKLQITTVDLLSGMKVVYSDNNNIRHAVLASSSFPIAFPPEETQNALFTDGGVMDIAPLSSVIEAGADEIVVVTTENPYGVNRIKKSSIKNVVGVASRVIELMTHEVLKNDIKMCAHINRNIRSYPFKKKIKLSVFYPTEALGNPLDFSNRMMEKQIKQGWDRADEQIHTSNG